MIVVFDFDGTIVDSERAKLSAFASLFTAYPEYDEIVNYNAGARGIPRRQKFEYICENILYSKTVAKDTGGFLYRYEKVLEITLSDCTLIKGLFGFIEKIDCKIAIVSSAPVKEIEYQLKRLKIYHFFETVVGYPVSKHEALSGYSNKYANTVFFGDARADYDTAKMANVSFIGVRPSTNRNAFNGLNIPMIEDYSDAFDVRRKMDEVISLS